jgi:hypothetical protein
MKAVNADFGIVAVLHYGEEEQAFLLCSVISLFSLLPRFE